MKKLFFIGLILYLNRISAQKDSVFSEKGIASFYSKKFNGRKCSSGEIFRNDSLTAAHKSLKFDTKIKVTNLKNDSSVILRVNDRLPKRSKRCVDVTLRAARQLNFIQNGLTRVKIEIIKDSLP